MLASWRGTAESLLISHGIGALIGLFERLGRYAPSATLHGILVRMFPTNPFVEELPDTVQRLRDALGAAQFEALQRRGGVMSVHEATEYAEQQIREALAALSQPLTQADEVIGAPALSALTRDLM